MHCDCVRVFAKIAKIGSKNEFKTSKKEEKSQNFINCTVHTWMPREVGWTIHLHSGDANRCLFDRMGHFFFVAIFICSFYSIAFIYQLILKCKNWLVNLINSLESLRTPLIIQAVCFCMFLMSFERLYFVFQWLRFDYFN